MFLCAVISSIGLIAVTNKGINTSYSLGQDASMDSMRSLESSTRERLKEITKAYSFVISANLEKISNYVRTIANNVSKINSNEITYIEKEILPPDKANQGVNTTQLLLAPGVDQASIQQELDTLSGISMVFSSIHSLEKFDLTLSLCTESGIVLLSDKNSGTNPSVIDAKSRPWYIAAKEKGALAWSDVFKDAFSEGFGIACSKPIYDSDGNLTAVVSCLALIDDIADAIKEVTIGESGYMFIVDSKGDIILNSNATLNPSGQMGVQNIFEIYDSIPEETKQNIQNKKNGFEFVLKDGSLQFMAYEPLQTMDWMACSVIDYSEICAPAIELGLDISEITESFAQDIRDDITIIICFMVGLVTLLTIIISLVGLKLSKGITAPIINMANEADMIGNGADNRITASTNDELEILAGAFNKMIDNIKLITSEKERISAELDVASKIQASMLPCIFPPFPNLTCFDIYAMMLPAKEVGGDFYDFFLLDQNHLCIVIADVSGKGVPAALFMVVAKTLIKNNAQLGKSPSEIFETVNEQLCENNQQGMFVTAFMGIYELSTGKFTYTNAGHNLPLIKRCGKKFEFLNMRPCFVLGGMEGIKYREEELYLQKGDVIYFYTDGVTEAINESGELYSDDRLLESINSTQEVKLDELLYDIKKSIDKFAGNAEQADDITMLTLRVMR